MASMLMVSWLVCPSAAFRGGDFRRGAIEGVLGAARYAAEFFPLDGENPNELPNEMVFL